MNLRRDHVAGGVFIAAGALVSAVSADLPFGTLASPGAGMLPTLVTVLMIAFGVLICLGARTSPPFASLAWDDLPHAVRVIAIAAVAARLYTTLGFLVTMALLLFALTFLVERRPLATATLFSLGTTGLAYLLFGTLLKSPLPRGVLGF